MRHLKSVSVSRAQDSNQAIQAIQQLVTLIIEALPAISTIYNFKISSGY